MGVVPAAGRAYYKAMLAAGNALPLEGGVYITVRDEDKGLIVPIASQLVANGLTMYATLGTAAHLREHGVEVTTVYRISENRPPDALGLMRRGEIRLIINTPTSTSGARRDGYMMRRLAIDLGVPFITTIRGAAAAAAAITEVRSADLAVKTPQALAKENPLMERYPAAGRTGKG